jgi:hypothetical protein
VPEAETTLNAFLQAARDSDFVAMSENWGTARGSARETGTPPDYQRRMVIIEAYMRGIQYRVLSNEPVPNENNLRLLQVEIARGGCIQLVPFTMIRTGGGRWLVNEFDLEKVGSPARGCAPRPAAPPG